MGISVTQLLIVLVIAVVVFGTKRLKNVGGDLGSAIKSFRNALREEEDKPSENNSKIIDGEVTSDQEKD
jgi:sec-independent protein translocase protein TatA